MDYRKLLNKKHFPFYLLFSGLAVFVGAFFYSNYSRNPSVETYQDTKLSPNDEIKVLDSVTEVTEDFKETPTPTKAIKKLTEKPVPTTTPAPTLTLTPTPSVTPEPTSTPSITVTPSPKPTDSPSPTEEPSPIPTSSF